jgi:hypothetical protein
MTVPKEETVDRHDRAVEHRLSGPPRVAERAASDDAARAAQIQKFVSAHRNDVAQQIELGQKLQREFERSPQLYPRTRRVAATELLRAYNKLKELEKKALRDKSGRLLTRTALDPAPRLWMRHGPHNVEEVPPFSPAHVAQWKTVGDVVAASSAPAPLPVVAKPKLALVPQPATTPLEYTTVKVPGMSLATPTGCARILSAVIGLVSGRAITADAARRIASEMDLWKYLVLDFEDTPAHATKVYDSLPLGWTRLVKLRREFLTDLQKRTSAKLSTTVRYWGESNGVAREYMQDFTSEERSWYVLGRLANKPAKDRRSGYTPGQFVSADGVIFVGPEVDDSLFYTPDGRLFGVPQQSVRDQQLGAIIQGAKWARGGPILGYGVVAIGAAALAAPAIAAAAAEILAAGITASGGVVATVEAITYTRYFVWVVMNWQAAVAWGAFAVGLGIKLWNFSPREFIEEFKKDPKEALKNLGLSFVETMHDFAEAYTSTPRSGHIGGGHEPDVPTPTSKPKALPAPVVDEPHVAPSVPATTQKALPAPVIDEPHVAPSVPATTQSARGVPDDSGKLVQQKMVGSALQKTAKPANDGGAPNAGQVLPQAEAQNDAAAPALQRTGTGGASVQVAPRPVAGGSGVTYQPSASKAPVKPDAHFDESVDAARGKVSSSPAPSGRSTGGRASGAPTTRGTTDAGSVPVARSKTFDNGSRYRILGDRTRLRGSTSGYQVYVWLDEDGRVLYVGRSGSFKGTQPGSNPRVRPRVEAVKPGTPEEPFHNWVDRLDESHIKTPWIGQARKVRVYSDLSYSEMTAVEDHIIDQNRGVKHTWNWNEKGGDFAPLGDLGVAQHVMKNIGSDRTTTFGFEAESTSW